jgi:hypothetical protein
LIRHTGEVHHSHRRCWRFEEHQGKSTVSKSIPGEKQFAPVVAQVDSFEIAPCRAGAAAHNVSFTEAAAFGHSSRFRAGCSETS